MLAWFANPERFMRLSAWALPLATTIALVLFAIGLPWALLFSPADFRQGDSVRIMFVHVPAAWWALGIYVFMGVASLMGLVWKHALADVAARAAAPIGAAYAALCLVTGSFWGATTWGTWWEWDARMTSMLVLFLTYVGYLALWAAIEDEQRAARLAGLLCLGGLINIPIVHFSVDWWNSLHQTASILRTGGSAMDPSMLRPLLVVAFAYFAGFIALLFAGMRAQVFRRRALAAAMRRARAA
ncbi:MAG: cytochrome c biogenesis protein CcsA [Hyphomonadaceae bacterium]|nr:MAG: heme exporter protein C [Caulobacteraceae bacterium]MBT9446160.1 cytochrome c biogenesis protein CcsA [Hyphomonadaceae bacterium]